jgi:hypothetical protein
MWFAPDTLSLITTHRCTAACEHCCFGCSPDHGRTIPLDRLYRLVAETEEIPTLRKVVFTGGECFLLGRHLDALVRECTARRLGTRCVTNGSWATGPAAAAARIAALRDAGLEELNFSTGPFHARFVPLERVVWGAAAAAEGGLAKTIVNVEAFEGADLGAAEVAGHPGLAEHVASGRVQVTEGAWIANGGEWEGCSPPSGLAHPDRLLRFQEGAPGPCTSSLRAVSVTPSQDLVTCCGLNLEHIPQLRLANLRDRTLRQGLDDAAPDLLKMWIHVEGPEAILAFARDRDPEVELPDRSAHICHTCQFLHRNHRVLEVLARHRREVEERVLERFLMASACAEVMASLT